MTAGLLTAEPAALEVGVSTATVRKWVQQGHLRAVGKRGRAQLFRLEDIFAAERNTRRAYERTHAGGRTHPRGR
ncbi:hypothetical protein SMD11_3154 [Streptomyces albireticuli]|uniref:Helix-turn-helix domain-containing protein n=1 Tax=Streptomyces albireticuli TaxID=1940 RepID=A0A1Z2L3D0_9ACTN|nr:helix-turn-helix domain-containing protein [Streptomyces albireticuli]ARZ68797.1 hypothetical protein SMD11_3154 [Streptomyces albireticuli]